MSLQERLSARRAQFEAKAPKEALAVMHRATAELRRSGIMQRAAAVGDRVPGFELVRADGQRVAGSDLLRHGPLVLNFYRGHW